MTRLTDCTSLGPGALFGWLYVEVQARQPRKSISIALSSLLVLCLACALVLGGKAIGMSGGGAIAAIAMGTVVANKRCGDTQHTTPQPARILTPRTRHRPSNSPSTTTLPAQAPHDHDNDDDSTGSDDGDDDDRAHMAGDEVMTWVVSKINSVLAVLWSLVRACTATAHVCQQAADAVSACAFSCHRVARPCCLLC